MVFSTVSQWPAALLNSPEKTQSRHEFRARKIRQRAQTALHLEGASQKPNHDGKNLVDGDCNRLKHE